MARRTLVTAEGDGTNVKPEGIEARILDAARSLPYLNVDNLNAGPEYAGDRGIYGGLALSYENADEPVSNLFQTDEGLQLNQWDGPNEEWKPSATFYAHSDTQPPSVYFNGGVWARYYAPVGASSNSGGTGTQTCSNDVGYQQFTLNHTCTVAAPSNFGGFQYVLVLEQDGTGGRVVTLSGFKTDPELVLPTAANTKNILTFVRVDNQWYQSAAVLGIPN